MNFKLLGKRCYESALKRGKIYGVLPLNLRHKETISGLMDEVIEVIQADEEKKSIHLPQYTEVCEELADVALVVFTELYRRGVDIDKILHEKASFNERRLY